MDVDIEKFRNKLKNFVFHKTKKGEEKIMISEVFGRELKLGDFVLFSTRKGDMDVTNHGIVISQSSVFCTEDRSESYATRSKTQEKGIYSPVYVYKISVMDDIQSDIYEQLCFDYQQYLKKSYLK